MSRGIRHLEGRTALVTGAANGIGKQLVIQLADRGAHIAAVDIDGVGLDALREALPGDRRVSTHVVDVSDREAMRALVEEVRGEHDQLHVLINNAGVGYEAAFHRMSLEALERVLGVNLWGAIHGCHFFLPWLAKADRAHIVNLSSLLGIVGMPGQVAYSTSKYAVRGFSECLWEELRGTSVGLTVAHPGSVATDIMKNAEGDDPELLAHLAAWYTEHALPPERVASRIVKAIRRGKRRLMIGPEVRLADAIKRLMPVMGNRAFSDLAIRMLDLEHMRAKRADQWKRTMVDGE